MTAPLPGVILAAPHSGAGKTTLTMAILRALAGSQTPPAPAKVGPDYIDPQFHRLASGRICINLDPWAMKPDQIMGLIGAQAADAEWILAEGVMGLFDGALGMGRSGYGSTADLAGLTGWPVVLIMDARGQGATMAAVVRGLRDHRPNISIAGIILNKVGRSSHVALLKSALEEVGIPVLGAVPKNGLPHLASRHLGLCQAIELSSVGRVVQKAADSVINFIDLSALQKIAGAWSAQLSVKPPVIIPPLGQRIAIAHDAAFAFAYDHVMDGWHNAGAELKRFSPLDDEAPDPAATAIYIPGGYPELHAGRLAAAQCFKSGMRRAAQANVPIYGECGGYMALGRGLVDGDGVRHVMLGLLDHETSFAERRLTLGYRVLDLVADTVLGRRGTRLFGHEFHYAIISKAGQCPPLGRAMDASGQDFGLIGGLRGSVVGSFFHMIAA